MINNKKEQGLIKKILDLWENAGTTDEVLVPEMNEEEGWVARLNKSEVWQHNIIWVCFLFLVLTGMMAFIPPAWIVVMFGKYAERVYLWRRYFHFIFAFGLFIGSVMHVSYLFFTKEGREVFMDILLRPHDFPQMVDNVKYLLGFKDEQPLFDRYDYKEKLEYLFGCIGTCVIFITGMIMTFAAVFPRFAVEVAATFHLMEATLASLAISIWHFYAVHWKPGKFPQDTSWLDGKMPLHHLQEEHPIYYDKIMKQRHKQMGYEKKNGSPGGTPPIKGEFSDKEPIFDKDEGTQKAETRGKNQGELDNIVNIPNKAVVNELGAIKKKNQRLNNTKNIPSKEGI